jgi:hypothetical protein
MRIAHFLLAFLILACGHTARAEPQTVCTITVNSADEKDAFRRNLPKDKFEFVELVEPGNRDWLASACQRKIQCDVLVISGHFGGAQVGATEFYSAEVGGTEFLPVEEMERASCSESCPGLFSRLKEVYLFGCETLSPAASQATSASAGPFVSASAGHGTSESPNSLAATTWWTGSLCFARTVRGRSIRSHRDFSAGRVEMMNPA